MAQIDLQLLDPIARRLVESSRATLSPAEYAELLWLAQAIPSAASARAAGVARKTAKERRKRIYRKLGVSGANEVMALLLRAALALLGDAHWSAGAARPGPAVGFADDAMRPAM